MESISSGMNFLKRRFSSQDINDDENSESTQHSTPLPIATGPPTSSFSIVGFANKVSNTISAPASPAKNQQSMYSQVQGLTRNLMQAASTGLSTYTSGPHKCILVVDDQFFDWSKYFRNNRTGWQLRIEQAQFGELDLCCISNQKCLIDIKSPSKDRKTIQPDFVVFRQAVKSEKGDFSNIVTALLKSNVCTLNSKESILTFLNKAWMHSYLERLNESNMMFPLIEQTYYPSFKHFIKPPRFPIVVRVGNGIHGVGKMLINDDTQLKEFEGVIQATREQEVFVEPFIDTKFDVHLQKIGSECKAFLRRSITNYWKSNGGSAMLEQIALTNKHKQWIQVISDIFGGLEVFGIDILVCKDGREFIHDVNDVVTLIGDSQEEDRRAIADLVQTHIMKQFSSQQQQQGRRRSQTQNGQAADREIPQQQPPALPTRPLSTSTSRSSTFDQETSKKMNMNGSEQFPRDRTISQPGHQTAAYQANRPVKQSSIKETTSQQDDTMGQLKRTFAGIFGDV